MHNPRWGVQQSSLLPRGLQVSPHGARGPRGRISSSPASRHRGFGGAICPCRRHLIRCCAAMAFGRVQSVLMPCCDLIVSSCLMMARLLGDDKNKLLVWLWLRSVKQWRRSLCRLSVLYCSAIIILFFKMHPMSHLHGLLAKSAILSQPRRVEVMNKRCPIGQRYGQYQTNTRGCRVHLALKLRRSSRGEELAETCRRCLIFGVGPAGPRGKWTQDSSDSSNLAIRYLVSDITSSLLYLVERLEIIT